MQKLLIRHGVFETNSSSCHSVSVADETKQFVLDTIYPDQNGEILLTGGEFGWEWFKHNDAITKANYAAQSFNGNENHMEMLIDVIKEQTGAEEVLFDTEKGYIDHDSYGTCPTNREELKNFIFNKNSWLFGGNDNSSADPMFYIVPEYKDGKMIQPVFKYELSVEGYDKTTKFLEMPTEEEISDALYSLLQGVRLYDNGNGVFFDDDNSIMAQIHRPDNYFEFTSWKVPIDYENQKVSFVREAWNSARAIYESENHPKEHWQNGGYDQVRKLEEQLLQTQPEKFVRTINYSIKEIEKRGKKS